MLKETIQLFRTISDDYKIQQSQIIKFIKWGNNDLQQALNFYYRKLEKSQKNQTQNKFLSKKQEIKKQKYVESCQIQQQIKDQIFQKKQQITIFDKMKKASIKQKKTEQFINRVRKQFQLPVNGKQTSSQNLKKQNQDFGEIQDQYNVEQQFKDADYLPSLFNKNQNNQIQIQEEYQLDQLGQYEEINRQLKEKISQIIIQTQNVKDLKINKMEKTQSKTNIQPKLNMSQKQIKSQKVINNLFQFQRQGMRTRNNTKYKSIPKFQMYQSFEQIKEQKISVLINKQVQSYKKENNLQIKVQIPNQIYIGQYIFIGFKTDTKPFPYNLTIGQKVTYRYYIEPQKSKKGNKTAKTNEKFINMRICFEEIQICRVQDHQARILAPLITQNIIRLQIKLHQLPYVINTFSKVKFQAFVYLKKKALTEPVVQTFDGQSQQVVNIYKGIRQQLSGLFERLNLKVKTQPLIKNKSKYTKKNINQIKQKNNAIQFQKKKLQFQKKEQEYNIRKQTDPFFKVKQVNLTEMIKKSSINQNSQSSQSKYSMITPFKQKNQNDQKSQIKKKVIEMNVIEQNKYSQLIDLYQEDVQPIYPKSNFKSDLYTYQAIALAWMLKRQGKLEIQNFKIQKEIEQIHPLWTEYELPSLQNQMKNEEKYIFSSLYYNQLTAQTSLIQPVSKIKCRGGILADEMGLGKTVMMASLIASQVQKNLKKNQAQNLVVVPLTLLSQWQSQIKKHTKNISVICYYTSERNKLIDDLGKYSVVITTYGTLSHQFTKMTKLNKIGLYKYKWKRIILDQAHYIKGRIIQTSKAAYNLQGQCRWCLTGTPIQNGLNDLFSLIHFIKYSPWAQFQCWSKYIVKPHENNDQRVYQVLRTLLKRVFLRRTKNSKDNNGKSIIQLPKKFSKIQILQMSSEQRQFYDMVYESSKAKIDQLDKLGIITAKYMQVLEILMKLRQICCHPVLFKSVTKYIKNPQSFQAELRKFIKKRQNVKKDINQISQNYFQPIIQGDQQFRVQIIQQNQNISQNFLKQTVQKIIGEQELDNCLVCLDNVQDPVITSCLHIFCKNCMIRQIQQFGNCASCRKQLNKEDFLHLPRNNRFNVDLQSQSFKRSTKMIALMEHLKNMKQNDKAVVFSQFLGMLDLLQHDLKKNKIKFVRMEGSTPQKQRAKIINSFSLNSQIKVFLVSLKTAGVGLNLVAANKVFLMDPWWNPGVQQQAIQRVHRIGQKKQVQVIRFIMDKTIQMRMIELNNQKRNLSQMVLSFKDNQNQSKLDKLKYLLQKY